MLYSPNGYEKNSEFFPKLIFKNILIDFNISFFINSLFLPRDIHENDYDFLFQHFLLYIIQLFDPSSYNYKHQLLCAYK